MNYQHLDVGKTKETEQLKEGAESRKDECEDVRELQAAMTLYEREAAMCLVAYFAGSIDESNRNPGIMYLHNQAAYFFGISGSAYDTALIMLKFPNLRAVIDALRSIQPVKAKEFLILTCYDLANISGNSSLRSNLEKIAAEMGYDSVNFNKLVGQYKRH